MMDEKMLFKKSFILFLGCALCVIFLTSGEIYGQELFKDVVNKKILAGGDKNKCYYLIGDDFRLRSPNAKFGLVIVMPGGDGGEGFNPFVQRIFKNSLTDKYIIAQLVAVKWSKSQQVVWPTKKVKETGQKFSTEEFVEAVIKDVGSRHKLDREVIFTLSWSSGGPAGYAVSLDKDIGVTGSYVAMSVFKPESLGSMESAKGHGYFIDHSPEDKICPFRMAQEAKGLLTKIGAKVKLVTYDGGHGWQGNVYSRIRYGIRWLEKNHAKPKEVIEEVTEDDPDKPDDEIIDYTIIQEDFERGIKVPKGWQKGSPVKSVSYIWDTKIAFKGKGSLCLKKTERKYFPIAQWFKEFSHDEVSTELEVNVKVKAEQMTKAIVDVQFTDENGDWLGHEWACYIGARKTSDSAANHDWKDYSGTVAIPEGTKTIIMALQIYGPGTVWFDELTGAYLPQRRKVENVEAPKEDVTDKPAETEATENDDKDGSSR